MIQLHRIGSLEEKIDFNNTNKSKECKICHWNCFSGGFEFYLRICNWSHWGIKSFENLAIIAANGVGYRFFV